MIDMSYIQLLTGISTSFLNSPYPKFDWIESGWLTSLWAFITASSLQIRYPKHWTPTVSREGDVNLLEYFLAKCTHAKILCILNRC
jgi:hypothetical protein